MFVNYVRAKTERQFYWKIPLYYSYYSNAAYFIIFPEAAIRRWSKNKKYLFFKYGRKIPAEK